MDINGKTKVYGVIGQPIDHTLSPILHNAVFQKRGIDAVYLPFEVMSDELLGAIEGLKAFNIQGLNITLPHKEQALHYVDAVPKPIDKAIGAINTLVLNEGRVLGFNTDGAGFIDDLKQTFSWSSKSKNALVLGAGGASRAVCFSLLEDGIETLYILNRTAERADGLVRYLTEYFPDKSITRISSSEDLDSLELDLMVNSTACGMKDDDPMPVDPLILDKVKHYYDLVYTPAETRLLKRAKELDIPSCNGMGMLLRQAVFAHRLWFPEADKIQVYDCMVKAYQKWKQ